MRQKHPPGAAAARGEGPPCLARGGLWGWQSWAWTSGTCCRYGRFSLPAMSPSLELALPPRASDVHAVPLERRNVDPALGREKRW